MEGEVNTQRPRQTSQAVRSLDIYRVSGQHERRFVSALAAHTHIVPVCLQVFKGSRFKFESARPPLGLAPLSRVAKLFPDICLRIVVVVAPGQ